MNLKTFFAFDPGDNDDIRLEKFTIFLVAASCCAAGLVWTAMYTLIFGFGLIAMLPLSFVLIVGLALLRSGEVPDCLFKPRGSFLLAGQL